MDIDSTSTTPPNIPLETSAQGHAQGQRPQQPHDAAPSRPLSASGLDAFDFSPDRRPRKSSSTCTTCRARKVRCDGARAVCSNCQRLGFPCSYDDADPGTWTASLPRRRVKQACLSCHSRKARCSGHVPACDRCRAQGIECVYRPSKRARTSKFSGDRRSPQSQDGDRDRDDGHNDSDHGLTDSNSITTPTNFNYDIPGLDESFNSLIGRTFEKFFRHVHHIPMYSFLHRASLMEQYHAGKVDRALLLALVGITSCLTDMGPGMREYGSRCIDDAEALIFADYTRPSTIKVQALVFMIKHRILCSRFPSAFMLLSIASRYAAALRLNHDSPNICFLAQESRRRLIWAIYCIDSNISGGYPDFALWDADKIVVSLPCNERNFEFDLPQETEKLVHNSNEPRPSHIEDVGSLALHIRILYIRRKIIEFTKGVLLGRTMSSAALQTRSLELHKELDDFATQLPASFQFSENSLRLRAYSPRICAFVMIHIWWRQCHCDLYRLGLVGLREALPRTALANIDDSFLEHCQRQCFDHSLAMANIFSLMQKLNARPVADLDLATCAYQCVRMLSYSYYTSGGRYDLTAETVMDRAKICVQAVKQCCSGPAAAGIRHDLEKLLSQGLKTSAVMSRRDVQEANKTGSSDVSQLLIAHSLHKSSENTSGPNVISSGPDNTHHINSKSQETYATTASRSALSESANFDPWSSSDARFPAADVPEVRVTSSRAPAADSVPQPQQPPRSEPGMSELNNAYEGAMDGLGLDNGLDFAMGLDLSMAAPAPDWMNPEFLTGATGME
ncbi:Nitrogen assimilation transcription factor nit-4 [Paramyrothecium foliicola]|nr:Nitrogen assimilation transcription factor nit-4 [Paramyrothecium foliicola]